MFETIKEWYKIRSGNDKEIAAAQLRLLTYALPFLDAKDSSEDHRTAKIEQALIDESTYLNELKIMTNPDVPAKENLLLIHGYGAGMGMFYRNFNGLSSFKNKEKSANIYAFDLLGHSISSNIPFDFKESKVHTPKVELHLKKESKKVQEVDDVKKLEDATGMDVRSDEDINYLSFKDSKEKLLEIANKTENIVQKYEDYYVESIEKWRISKNLDKFTLLGHSFGGYLSMCYTLKYPERIEKLILASPVGVERSVYSTSSMKKRVELNELTKVVPSTDITSYNHVGKLFSIPSFLMKIWDTGYLPFSVLRGLGPIGVYTASMFTGKRYDQGANDQEELKLLSEYVLSTFWKKSSTELAISRILSPIVSARVPIIDKIENFAKNSPTKKLPPILWIYGQNDWMTVEAGKICAKNINDEHLGGKSEFKVLSNSGHNLFLDNPSGFNRVIKKYLGWD